GLPIAGGALAALGLDPSFLGGLEIMVGVLGPLGGRRAEGDGEDAAELIDLIASRAAVEGDGAAGGPAGAGSALADGDGRGRGGIGRLALQEADGGREVGEAVGV